MISGYKEDADLPVLTMAYQVDASREDELRHILRVVGGREFRVKDYGSDGSPAELEKVAAACQLAQRIMNALHVRGMIHRGDLEELVERRNQYKPTFDRTIERIVEHSEKDIMTHLWDSNDRPKDEVTMEMIADYDLETWRKTLFNSTYALLSEIYNGLYKLLSAFFDNADEERGKKVRGEDVEMISLLRRCPECTNLFLPRRAKQTFCTHRCLHRKAMRKG